MAATQRRMIETASRAGPRLAVELVGTAFQFVPGVPAPNTAAALLTAVEVGEALAEEEEEVVEVEVEEEDRLGASESDGVEIVEEVGVASGAAAEERMLGQKVALHCCISANVLP